MVKTNNMTMVIHQHTMTMVIHGVFTKVPGSHAGHAGHAGAGQAIEAQEAAMFEYTQEKWTTAKGRLMKIRHEKDTF